MRLTRAAKFKNVRANGFDSKREQKRYADLQLLERAGEITHLERQVRFQLIPAQRDAAGKLLEREVAYVADFRYIEDGDTIIEDVKGFETPDFKIKRKLMLFRHGIRLRIIK